MEHPPDWQWNSVNGCYEPPRVTVAADDDAVAMDQYEQMAQHHAEDVRCCCLVCARLAEARAVLLRPFEDKRKFRGAA